MVSRRRLAAALLLVCLAAPTLLLAAAPQASGHADFLSSTPSPYAIWNQVPTAVSVTLSEAVQPGSPTILITNLTGARVDTGPTNVSPTDPDTISVHLLSGLGPSVYTVTWAVVSADDGHFTAGTFYFMVSYKDGRLPGQFPQTGALALSEPLSPLDVALEAAGFVGFAAAFGGILLVGLLWAPLGAGVEAADRERPAQGFRAVLGFSRLGAVAFTAAAAGLWAENVIRSPPSDLGGLVASTFLWAHLLEVAFGVVILVLATRVLTHVRPEEAFQELPWEFLPLIFLGFVVILLEVAASHSASEPTWWPLGPVADAVHLYGAALWVGGLLAILRARPWLRPPTPAVFSRDLLAAFSRFAFLGAVLVVSAGVILALIFVGTWEGLLGTAYGWTVLSKTALLAPLLAIGAWNRRTLRRDAAGGKPAPAAVERLARNVRMEAVLGAAVLVLAGLLVTMNPASAPQPVNPLFLLQATNGGLLGFFEVDPFPAAPGTYFFQLTLYYPGNGTPFFGGGPNATLTFVLVGGNATGATVPLDGPHDNHYFVQSSVLDAAGTWEVRAAVKGASGTPVVLSYTIVLHP